MISIGIVTYNTIFYTKLSLQKIREHTNCDYEVLIYDNGSTDGTREWLYNQNVRLYEASSDNQMGHGQALDFLARKAKYSTFCTLDSDAFPISDDWILPAKSLSKRTAIVGIDRTWGCTLKNYVHPSYLFTFKKLARKYTFRHNWPKYDTGEIYTKCILDLGKKVKYLKPKGVDFDGRFKRKPCDYAGLVWHVWWSSRKVIDPTLSEREFEPEYHEFCKNMFREKYKLEF
jgi:glycosyltransferase involved in cell wall biosynthesis